MKKHISLTWLLTMAVNGAIADGVGLPTNVCHDFCGARQQRIWARFERGEGLELATLPSVYAGVCHVFGDNINPDREHHVGFLIDHGAVDHGAVDHSTVDNDTVGHGSPHKLRLRFSFFTSAQPYGELDAAQAEDYFGAPVLPLGVYQGYAYAEANSLRFLSRYWFRRDRDLDRVLLVSYFGPRITILCDTDRNAEQNAERSDG
ncbi:hypothetical protein [Candidatus Spongiihabitans sp.]|uniref:hypothetical protein n=1 Tax=Candidatus Spongiihabitans sp. TaxID=3101308 RepID=UPI003C6EA722